MEKDIEIYQGDVRINMARVVCAFILHIQIIPEINSALKMMKFVRHNANGTGFYGKHTIFPFLIPFMKMTAGLITEITNVMVII